MKPIRKRYRILLTVEVEAPAGIYALGPKRLIEEGELPEALAADPAAFDHWMQWQALMSARELFASEDLETLLKITPIEEDEETSKIAWGSRIRASMKELSPRGDQDGAIRRQRSAGGMGAPVRNPEDV